MLEHGGEFLLAELRRVGARQAGVEGVLDGQLQLRAGAGLLAPVQHQQPLQASRLRIVPLTPEEGTIARNIIFTPKAARPPPAHSQAVKAAGLVFVSGTAAADPVTGQSINTA